MWKPTSKSRQAYPGTAIPVEQLYQWNSYTSGTAIPSEQLHQWNSYTSGTVESHDSNKAPVACLTGHTLSILSAVTYCTVQRHQSDFASCAGETFSLRDLFWSRHCRVRVSRRLISIKTILPPLLPGVELATFPSRVRRSYQQAIPTPRVNFVC